MSANPAELSAATIIARIEANEYPPPVLETIANGFLPLPQADLIAVLAFLARRSDAAIAEAARRSLHDIPMRSVAAFASDESAPPAHLALLARATDDATILEALIRNRAIDDDVIVDLAAATADPVVQEVIVINQTRILRAPQILDALLENPHIATDVRRRALETREEFFEKKARRAEEDVEVDESEIADLVAKAEEEDAAVPSPPQSLPDLSAVEANDPERSSVWVKILKMTVAERVRYAFRADRTGRMVLIRDRNKLVCTAVMRNPRVTETELEGIAGMRNIDEEVLRMIGTRRGWMAKYPIMMALCRNPKAPVGVVLPLVNRLTLRDLKSLKDDRGVSEVVRTMAKKLFIQRSQKS